MLEAHSILQENAALASATPQWPFIQQDGGVSGEQRGWEIKPKYVGIQRGPAIHYVNSQEDC